jgi:hypothetical protein
VSVRAARSRSARSPLLVRGDLVDDLPALAARAPAGATLVVFHTSVLYQVPPRRREAFADVVRALPGHWLANDEPGVRDVPPPPDGTVWNLLALVRRHRAPHTITVDTHNPPYLLNPDGSPASRPVITAAPGAAANGTDITVPADRGVALPGHWMLSALDAKGVPSVARVVRVG